MPTITVTNLNDSGPGSLRAAISSAAAGDTVTFATGLSGGVIRLASTLSVPVAITIDGDLNNDGAPDITISGDVNNDDIHAAGSTTVSDIIASAAANKVSDNVRVLYTPGDITIDGLIITGGNSNGGDGGGLLADGSINVSHSLIAGNVGGQGGGLWASFGAATITNSTLSGNTVTSNGNAAAMGLTALNLTNVTVSGNVAAGPYSLSSNGPVTVVNSTITGNVARFGAVTAPGGTMTITNSIIVGNQGGDAASNSPIVYSGLNIIGIGSDTNAADGRINAPSLAAVFASVAANPFSGVNSGVLADNGGGLPTVALNPSTTNPALDRSNASAPVTDVRGVARQDLQGLGNNGSNFADLGAFEVTDQQPTITSVPVLVSIAENTSTAAAIKFATLSITDADGNNTVSLSGADAALFEIQADGIYLKAGTLLDFETNPVLDVTLDVATLGFGTISGAASFNVTDVNEQPALTGIDSPVTFAENTVNATPQLIDADVSFTDPDNNFGGGTLTVSGLLAEDTVAIRNQGTAAGQIGVSGSDITYGGTIIGSFTGGSGSTLSVTFNTSATAAAIEALIENLTYANASNTPTATRTLSIIVTDAAGAETMRPSFAAAAINPLAGFDPIPSEGFDHTAPALADVDGDGDIDVVAGEYYGTLKYYENISQGASLVYEERLGNQNPFGDIDESFFSQPELADLDSDGDLDLLVGEAYGSLKYYTNTGSSNNPVYVAPASNPFSALNLGNNASPTLGDLDGDGDLDLVVGEFDGSLNYVENIGTSTNPVYAIAATNPFAAFNVGRESTPHLADVDGDGDLDLVAGALSGALFYFENVSAGGSLSFVARSGAENPFSGIVVSEASSPTVGDIDHDGDIDLVVGTVAGPMITYLNTPTVGIALTIDVTAENDAPVITSPASLAVTEDVASVLTGISFADVDAGSSAVTVTLSVGSGILSANAGGGLTVTGSNTSSVMLTGTVANINALIAGSALSFTTAANATSNVTLTISIDDNGNTGTGGAKSDSSTVTLAVTAVNDPLGTPADNDAAANTVVENAAAGTPVGLTALALDPDTALLTYSLTDDAGGAFDIDSSTGVVSVRDPSKLNYEALGPGKSLSVTVQASDGVETSTQAFSISVTDVNEAPTALTLSNQVASLAENTPTGTRTKIADIAYSDDALGSETVTVTGADAAFFEIFDGDLYLKQGVALNFEAKSSYSVSVNIDDPALGSGAELTQAVTLAVTDVNEAPTALAFSNALASIAENASTAARRKIADITVTDDALGTETLTVTGADAAKFEIFDGDLYLRAGATLDFETNRKLDVTVNVDDIALGSGIELSRALSVDVTDALETISGSGGSNTLNGSSGADRLNAGAGNDTVNGGGGDDILHGGAGVDRLTGGTGRDTFVFKSLTESGYHASGSLSEKGPLTDQAAIGQRDIITDFTPGFDEIDLSAIDANTTATGNQAFTFRGTGAFGGAGSLVYRKFDNAGTANDRTIVFADANGDGRSDFQIELTGLKTLSAGDFVL